MCVVDDIYLWYCVEGVIVCREGTDALAEVTDLDVDIPQEGAAWPLSHDHDFSGYTLARKSSMENPERMEWVTTYFFENYILSSPK